MALEPATRLSYLHDYKSGLERFMGSINLADAKAQLSALVERALLGETVAILRRGKRVADLVPARTARKRIDLTSLEAISSAVPPQPEADSVRQLREATRY